MSNFMHGTAAMSCTTEMSLSGLSQKLALCLAHGSMVQVLGEAMCTKKLTYGGLTRVADRNYSSAWLDQASSVFHTD